MTALLAASCVAAQAQFGNKLGRSIQKSAENATIRKAEEKTDKAVSSTIDKATDPDAYKEDGKKKTSDQDEKPSTKAVAEEQKSPKSIAAVYAKSDFVPGDEIFFEDNLSGEKLGEFPSQWDLINGSAEVGEINGTKCIMLEPGTELGPLAKDIKSFLPDVFTLEYDFWINDKNAELDQKYELYLFDGTSFYGVNALMVLKFGNLNSDRNAQIVWKYKTPSGESRSGEGTFEIQEHSWHRLSVSFNKRAFKAYVNGIRTTNIPNMAAPKAFRLYQATWGGITPGINAITDIRMAEGAVPLYDRMMSDGKFITYGITFDVGKSTIKPESYAELTRIVTLMQENPGLRFSIEGHTDATGNAASNQKLSDDRSKAVAVKLIEMGISESRLQAVGKGQNNPIADNANDEGRARNRRVEFVKL